MKDLRYTLQIEDYYSAWQYLLAKQEAQQKALEQRNQNAMMQQMAGRGGMG